MIYQYVIGTYLNDLIDNFDSIYDFEKVWLDDNGEYIYIDIDTGEDVSQAEHDLNPTQSINKRGMFKTDIINKPNNLTYFLDYLEPNGKYEDCSIDSINMRIYSYQEEKIVKLYNTDIPDVIILNSSETDPEEIAKREEIRNKCLSEGQKVSNVNGQIYNTLAENTLGYTAQETVRELLYQYTNFNENISLSTVPIYYLDVNSRITVQDKGSNIYGDFIIKSISVPLTANGEMNIGAVKALERI